MKKVARPATVLLWVGLLVHADRVAAAADAKAPADRMTVKGDGVVVHSQPSTTSIEVMRLMRGDVVEMHPADTTPEGTWCQVKEDVSWGRSGYALCKELEGGSPPPAPAAATTRPEAEVPPVEEKPPTEAPPPTEKPAPAVVQPGPTRERRYTVQVAALVVEQNALALKARLEKLGYRPVIRNTTTPMTRHRVDAGEFGSREQAEQTARGLKGNGFPSTVVPTEGGRFRVEVESFYHRGAATTLARRLEQKAYTPHLVSETVPTRVYLVRVGEYANQSEARRTLESLTTHGFTPVIVRP